MRGMERDSPPICASHIEAREYKHKCCKPAKVVNQSRTCKDILLQEVPPRLFEEAVEADSVRVGEEGTVPNKFERATDDAKAYSTNMHPLNLDRHHKSQYNPSARKNSQHRAHMTQGSNKAYLGTGRVRSAVSWLVPCDLSAE